MTMLTRFAPSPTGFLHLGHAFAAQCAVDFAARHQGSCLLRIEDIDHTRCRDNFTSAIYEDLAWLGLSWPEPVRVQSTHRDDYTKVIAALEAKGVLYRCFLTRTEYQTALARQTAKPKRRTRKPHAAPPDPVYRGVPDKHEASRLESGQNFAWRLSIPASAAFLGPQKTANLSYVETGNGAEDIISVNIHALSDMVIARKDIQTSYHIAVTHDDQIQNITHVVRGADFIALTGLHVLIQALMDWPTPIYHHHRLLRREDGQKLAKRRSDTPIRDLRAAGLSPKAVLEMAAQTR